MKTSLFILLVICSLVYTLNGLKIERKHDIFRFKRNAVLETAVYKLVDTSSNLKEAFANNELQSAGDVGHKMIKSIPIFGDIVHLLSENKNPTFDVESALNTINENFKILDETIKDIGTRVDALSIEIDLSVMINQVATDKREISNCYTDFLLFIHNPSSKAEQDRLKHCYSKFAYVRQIGNILVNNKLTFMQQPIFDRIIEITGYCDGERLQDVYLFLLGLYQEGCTALITSEVLRYGNDSKTFQDECKLIIQTAMDNLDNIFKNCRMEPCSKYMHIMTNSLKTDQASTIKLKLQASFPWFHIVAVTLRKSARSGIAIFNIRILNYLTLSSNGVVYRVLLWSLKTNTSNSTGQAYGIEYSDYEIESIYNGLRLNKKNNKWANKLDWIHE